MNPSSAYDLLDRFLRNNLGDEDYAKHLQALDVLSAMPEPLTDDQIRQIVRDVHRTIPLPYDITFARAIEAAHGIRAA